MIYVGIDPGKSGGIGFIFESGEAGAFLMPDNTVLLDRTLRKWNPQAVIATIERVGFFKMGRVGAGNYGIHYGEIRGILTAHKIPFHEIMPQSWKKEVLAGTAKDKAAAIAYCRQAWPELNLIPEGHRKESDGMADALCICEFGRRKFR